MADRERLWNAVEATEKRKDARLARETQLALPRELDREAQLALLRGFVGEQMVARGMVADFAVHDVKARDGGRQPHAHVMTTTRAIDPAKPLGFGGKVRAWDDKAMLLEWREAWADHVNRALEAGRIAERVDHRTLEAQHREAVATGDFDRAAELDREPEPKVGWEAWQLERKGVETERGDLLRAVVERNEERGAVYERVGAAGGGERARFLELREELGDALEAFLAWGTEVAERARAFARGAMVAGTVGLAGLGLLPERDSVAPAAPPTVEAPLSLEDEIVEGVLEDLAVERRLREIEAMGHECTDPDHVLADPDPTDRLARVEAREAAERRREEDGARHEALDGMEDLDADVGRAERQRTEEERLAGIGAMARAERAEVEGTGLGWTYPPDALAIEDPPERTDATDDRVALEARMEAGPERSSDLEGAMHEEWRRTERERPGRLPPSSEREGAIVDAYAATLPEPPDPAEIGGTEARIADREPSGEREPEAGAESVEAESPEGEDWLDAIIDEALAEGRTARDRQRSRGME